MADIIPEGYGVIAGRGRENAIKALAAADAAGVDQYLVRTRPDGYLAPLAVIEAFDKANEEATPEAEPVAAPKTEAELEAEKAAAAEAEGTKGEAGDTSTGETPAIEYPKGNASHDVWLAFAATQDGFTEADRDLSYADLKAKFGPQK